MRDSFKLFDCIEGVQDLPLKYTFSDNDTLDITLVDIARFLSRKMLKVPSVVGTTLTWLDPYLSLATNWDNFNDKTKDNFTRIKDALAAEYEILDNYNGTTTSLTTDTFNKNDTLSFTNREDTRTLNHTDELSFTNRQDTHQYNNVKDELTFDNRKDTHSIDPLDKKQTEVTHSGEVRTENYVAGYNTPAPAIESATNVINGYNASPLKDTTIESGTESDTKSGKESNTKSGSEVDSKSGKETDTHSGTIKDAKTGNETTAQTGTISHAYTETKHGNLGVTSSQQMLTSELQLRLQYQLKDLILNAFIDEYTFY